MENVLTETGKHQHTNTQTRVSSHDARRTLAASTHALNEVQEVSTAPLHLFVFI